MYRCGSCDHVGEEADALTREDVSDEDGFTDAEEEIGTPCCEECRSAYIEEL